MADPKVLVVGVGNIIRGDDGVGSYICAAIEEMKLANVSTLQVHQLNTELIEDLHNYDHIVIADASVEGNDVDFCPASTIEETPVSTSHHMNVAMLNMLSKKVYGKQLSTYVCAVKGEEFGMSDQLSPIAYKNANKAIQAIVTWIASLN